MFVLSVIQIFVAILLSFILKSCKNRLIKPDITSAISASESSLLSKSDTITFVENVLHLWVYYVCGHFYIGERYSLTRME